MSTSVLPGIPECPGIQRVSRDPGQSDVEVVSVRLMDQSFCSDSPIICRCLQLTFINFLDGASGVRKNYSLSDSFVNGHFDGLVDGHDFSLTYGESIMES